MDADAVLNKARELAEAFAECGALRRYRDNLGILSRDEEIYPLFISYKKLYNELIGNGAPLLSFEDERRLGAAYWDLMLNEKAKNFFEAEKELVELMKRTTEIVAGGWTLEAGNWMQESL